MAADGKLLQGQINTRAAKDSDATLVEGLLAGFLRALIEERSQPASAATTGGQVPARLREIALQGRGSSGSGRE